MESILTIDEKINKIWEMFENQLQRNYNLMTVIDKQQQVIDKMITSGYPNIADENNIPVIHKKEQTSASEKTVAPMPTYLVCSPSEQPSSSGLSAPEHRMKNCFNMID